MCCRKLNIKVLFLIFCWIAVSVESEIGLIVVVDNSPQTQQVDHAGHRWLGVELSIEQMRAGSHLTVIDLSQPGEPMIDEVLEGGFRQKMSLKSRLKKHQQTLSTTTIELASELRSIVNQRTSTVPRSIVILTHHATAANFSISAVNVEVITIKSGQDKVAILTQMAQMINQIQGFEVAIVQPISLESFGTSSFLIHDPRIVELQIQYFFSTNQTDMPELELRDSQDQFVYHYAESKNFRLYTVPRPIPGDWEVMFRNIDEVTQLISTKTEANPNLPQLSFYINPVEKSLTAPNGEIELSVKVIDSEKLNSGNNLDFDVLYAMVKQPNNQQNRIQLTADDLTKKSSFSTIYRPSEIGTYYITIQPSSAYVVLQPRHRVSIIPSHSSSTFPVLLALLIVVGGITTGGLMFVSSKKQEKQDSIDFFMANDLPIRDVYNGLQDNPSLSASIPIPTNSQQPLNDEQSPRQTESEKVEASITENYSVSDEELEKQLEDLSVSHDDILQLISESHIETEDESSDVDAFDSEFSEVSDLVSENFHEADQDTDFDDFGEGDVLDLEDLDQKFDNLDLDNLDLGLDYSEGNESFKSVINSEKNQAESTEAIETEDNSQRKTDSPIQTEVLDEIIEKTLSQ